MPVNGPPDRDSQLSARLTESGSSRYRKFRVITRRYDSSQGRGANIQGWDQARAARPAGYAGSSSLSQVVLIPTGRVASIPWLLHIRCRVVRFQVVIAFIPPRVRVFQSVTLQVDFALSFSRASGPVWSCNHPFQSLRVFIQQLVSISAWTWKSCQIKLEEHKK